MCNVPLLPVGQLMARARCHMATAPVKRKKAAEPGGDRRPCRACGDSLYGVQIFPAAPQPAEHV